MGEVRVAGGRVALVTGARAASVGRSRCSWPSWAPTWRVNDVDPAGAAEVVVAEIEALGRRGCVAMGDVSEEADVQAIVAAVEAALGPVDILVNNAGLTRDGFFVRMDGGRLGPGARRQPEGRRS